MAMATAIVSENAGRRGVGTQADGVALEASCGMATTTTTRVSVFIPPLRPAPLARAPLFSSPCCAFATKLCGLGISILCLDVPMIGCPRCPYTQPSGVEAPILAPVSMEVLDLREVKISNYDLYY